LAEKNNLLLDSKYVIMSEVADNEKVTQRELSKKLCVSVSTVNILINKMIREGLIKMTQVSQKQVLYMLTPAGMMEKAQKTVSYLKGHYRAIYETKENIKAYLESIDKEHNDIYILLHNDEMGDILNMAVHEYITKYNKANIKIIEGKQDICKKSNKFIMLIHMADNEEINKKIFDEYSDIENIEIINMISKL